MLEAIKQAGTPEIYVFADADIAPEPHWLTELLLPLSDPRLTATTGFRWLISRKKGIGDMTHTNVNAFFLVLFGVASFIRLGSLCWGGSMAIRKKDFDDINVAGKWARSGVDDISMAQVLAANNRRSILVPYCITPSDDLLETSGSAINWCVRQVMFLKSYHRLLWIFGLGTLWIMVLTLYIWLPFSIVASIITEHSFVELGGLAPLAFMIIDMITVLLYPLFGPVPKFFRFILLQPYFRFTHIITYWRTIFSKSIVWSGIKYTLAFSGDVTKVERLKD